MVERAVRVWWRKCCGRSVSVGPQCVGVQSRSDISFRHKVKASSRRLAGRGAGRGGAPICSWERRRRRGLRRFRRALGRRGDDGDRGREGGGADAIGGGDGKGVGGLRVEVANLTAGWRWQQGTSLWYSSAGRGGGAARAARHRVYFFGGPLRIRRGPGELHRAAPTATGGDAGTSGTSVPARRAAAAARRRGRWRRTRRARRHDATAAAMRAATAARSPAVQRGAGGGGGEHVEQQRTRGVRFVVELQTHRTRRRQRFGVPRLADPRLRRSPESEMK